MTSIHRRTWKTKSGTVNEAYRVKFTVKGKPKFRQFQTKREASAFVRNLDGYVEQLVQPPKLSVADAAEAWLAACRKGTQLSGHDPLDAVTLVTYRGYIRNHIGPAFGERMLCDVDRDAAIQFRDLLIDQCASRVTAKKVFAAFKALMKYALDHRIIQADVVSGLSIRIGARHRARVEVPSKREIEAVLREAERLSRSEQKRLHLSWVRYRLMLEVLIYAGLRLSELRGLDRKSFDIARGQITIRQRADRFGTIGPPKSDHARRSLYLPPDTCARLEAWLKTHNFDLVFPSRTGRAMSSENIRKRMWLEILTRANVRDQYHVHATRHFFASRLIESGATTKELSAALGHADEGFTLRVYGHLFHDRESEQRRKDRAAALVL